MASLTVYGQSESKDDKCAKSLTLSSLPSIRGIKPPVLVPQMRSNNSHGLTESRSSTLRFWTRCSRCTWAISSFQHIQRWNSAHSISIEGQYSYGGIHLRTRDTPGVLYVHNSNVARLLGAHWPIPNWSRVS